VVHYVFFSPNVFKIAICGLLEKNYVFRVTSSVTQLLQGKKLWETRPRRARLPRVVFGFSNRWVYGYSVKRVFMPFKVMTHRKIWQYFSAIIRLEHIVIVCVSVRSRFGFKRVILFFTQSFHKNLRWIWRPFKKSQVAVVRRAKQWYFQNIQHDRN